MAMSNVSFTGWQNWRQQSTTSLWVAPFARTRTRTRFPPPLWGKAIWSNIEFKTNLASFPFTRVHCALSVHDAPYMGELQWIILPVRRQPCCMMHKTNCTHLSSSSRWKRGWGGRKSIITTPHTTELSRLSAAVVGVRSSAQGQHKTFAQTGPVFGQYREPHSINHEQTNFKC